MGSAPFDSQSIIQARVKAAVLLVALDFILLILVLTKELKYSD